jgi:hypothetical protein
LSNQYSKVSIMNVNLRRRVVALFLLLPVATVMATLPSAATAQAAALEMHALQVSSDGGLSAGAQLGFTIEGTPRAQVNIRLDGGNRDITLKETSRGVYSGSYTIMRQDVLTQTSAIHAVMQEGGRNIVVSYTFPAGMATQPTAEPAASTDKLKIDRFTIVPLKKIEPGAELRFSLTGMRGGVADIEITGIMNHISMREVRPGVYEGAYTIRRQDNLTSSRALVATLWQGEKSVKANLNRSWVSSEAQGPAIRNLSPRDGSTPTGSHIVISASFDEADGPGIDPKTVRILLSGRNITSASKVTPQFFAYSTDLQPGHYTVDVTARDPAGAALRKSWSFNVAGASQRRTVSQNCDDIKVNSAAARPAVQVARPKQKSSPAAVNSRPPAAAKSAVSTGTRSGTTSGTHSGAAGKSSTSASPKSTHSATTRKVQGTAG